jgi:hypothetical protein
VSAAFDARSVLASSGILASATKPTRAERNKLKRFSATTDTRHFSFPPEYSELNLDRVRFVEELA